MLKDSIPACIAAIAVVLAFLISERFSPAPRIRSDSHSQNLLGKRVAGDVALSGTLEQVVKNLIARGYPIRATFPITHYSEEVISDKPVIALHLRDATLEQWMAAIECQLGYPRVTHYVESDGYIRIVAWEQSLPTVMRVYDARDLIKQSVAWTKSFPQQNAHRWQPGVILDPYRQAEYSLSELIKFNASQDTWEYVGSGGAPAYGGISIVDGRIVIEHTPATQRQIEVILAILRR